MVTRALAVCLLVFPRIRSPVVGDLVANLTLAMESFASTSESMDESLTSSRYFVHFVRAVRELALTMLASGCGVRRRVRSWGRGNRGANAIASWGFLLRNPLVFFAVRKNLAFVKCYERGW